VNLKLYHDGWNTFFRSPFGAAPTTSTVTVRLRAISSLSKATLIVTTGADKPYAKVVMTRTGHSPAASTWTGSFTTPATIGNVQYYFKAQQGSTTRYYGDSGDVDNGVGKTYNSLGLVNYYRINIYEKGFTTPSWMKNAVVYQIFPDRFYDGDKANDALEATGTQYGYITTYFHQNWSDTPQDGPPYSSDFYGGDLKGVDDKLPYLKSLGITAIYLNPIFLAPSDHKYDTSNYKEIDPEFGTLQTFETLVSDAKADGIRLILDGVFEDTGSDSIYFDKYGTFKAANGPGACDSNTSPYFSWYTFNNPSQGCAGGYQSWSGIDTIPLLKDTPAVENFFFKDKDSVAQYWLGEGIGGWRLDSADTLPMGYWRRFRTAIKAAYPDSVIIGEKNGWTDALPWLLGDQWDGVMNYQFRNAVLDFFANAHYNSDNSGPINASTFMNTQMGLLSEYPRPAILSSLNLVDSHDTARILNSTDFNETAVKLIAFYQMTWLGAPDILYGDETGVVGDDGNTTRATFPWSHQNTSLEQYYAGIIAMRHAYPALYQGSVTPLLTSNSQRAVAFLRTSGSQRVLVALNDSSKAQTITVPVSDLTNGTSLTGINPGNTSKLTVAKGVVSVAIPALTGEAFLAGTAQ
jgi:glycosidase